MALKKAVKPHPLLVDDQLEMHHHSSDLPPSMMERLFFSMLPLQITCTCLGVDSIQDPLQHCHDQIPIVLIMPSKIAVVFYSGSLQELATDATSLHALPLSWTVCFMLGVSLSLTCSIATPLYSQSHFSVAKIQTGKSRDFLRL